MFDKFIHFNENFAIFPRIFENSLEFFAKIDQKLWKMMNYVFIGACS